MQFVATILVAIVALAHLGFMILEMFYWTSPYSLQTFNMTPEFARSTVFMAANQGLYNGFIAAGLVWGLISHVRGAGIAKFFLACAIIAGSFGAVTVKPTIFYVQALPAVLAFMALLIWQRQSS